MARWIRLLVGRKVWCDMRACNVVAQVPHKGGASKGGIGSPSGAGGDSEEDHRGDAQEADGVLEEGEGLDW